MWLGELAAPTRCTVSWTDWKMNSRGSWEGISNASPAALALVPMTRSARQIFLWGCSGCSFPHDSVHFVRQLPRPKPRAASTQHSAQPKTQCSCQVERLIIDLKRKPWWLLYTYTSGEGRSLALLTRRRQTTSLPCLTGAGSWGFLDPQQGRWTGYHALWSHTLSPCRPRRCLPFVSNPLLTSSS